MSSSVFGGSSGVCVFGGVGCVRSSYSCCIDGSSKMAEVLLLLVFVKRLVSRRLQHWIGDCILIGYVLCSCCSE